MTSSSSSAGSIFDGDESDHAEVIEQLRQSLGPEINRSLNDHDCVRFLRARQGSVSKTVEMVEAWHEWRHSLMDPLPPRHCLRLSPNIILAHPDPVVFHPHKDLLPVAHVGNDKDGRPIYWEKTGYAQSVFDQVEKHFTLDELIQYHIQSQETFKIRMEYNSKLFGKRITDTVVVFDMNHLTMYLNLFSIQFLKRMIFIDQNYYPETLHQLFIINAPWYFTTLYAMFKPLVEKRTRDKIKVLGSNFEEALRENIEPEEIPEEYGGTYTDVPWGGPFPENTGISIGQLEEYMFDKYSPDKVREFLHDDEITSLTEALVHYSQRNNAETGRDEIAHEQQQSSDNILIEATSRPNMPLRSVLSQVSAYGDRESHRVMAVKLLRTKITHVVDAQKYHCYSIDIKYRNAYTWKARRRYSDFRLFMKEMKKLNATCEKYFPPKKLFKRSPSVVKERMKELNIFLKRSVVLCINSQKSHGIDALIDFLCIGDQIDSLMSSVDDNQQPAPRRQTSVSFSPQVEVNIVARPSSLQSDGVSSTSGSEVSTGIDNCDLRVMGENKNEVSDSNRVDNDTKKFAHWPLAVLLLFCSLCAMTYGSRLLSFLFDLKQE